MTTPKPLTEAEMQSLLRLQARIHFAWKIRAKATDDEMDTSVPLEPILGRLPTNVKRRMAASLIHDGAHHLALTQYASVLNSDKSPQTALSLAISALLWGEMELATEWAMKSLILLESKGFIAPSDNMWLWSTRELMQLAKVFRALGRENEVDKVRKGVNGILNDLSISRDPGLDSVRLAVELGWDKEADTLLRKLPPLVVGHSRGPLLRRLFRTLFNQDKVVMAWAILAMTTESHDEETLRYCAMQVACAMGNYELALKIGAHDGHEDKDFSYQLEGITTWLIANGRVQDWRQIWSMLTDDNFGLWHRFSRTVILRFLANLVEHVSIKDRKAMHQISKRIYEGMRDIPNQDYFKRIAGIHLVIAAYIAPEEEVQSLSVNFQPSKGMASQLKRIAMKRDFHFLFPLIDQATATMHSQPSLESLHIELSLLNRGKRHRLDAVVSEELAIALANNDSFMVYLIVQFVGRN